MLQTESTEKNIESKLFRTESTEKNIESTALQTELTEKNIESTMLKTESAVFLSASEGLDSGKLRPFARRRQLDTEKTPVYLQKLLGVLIED